MAARRGARTCLAVTRPGLEAVCDEELRALGLRPTAIDPGAVAFRATDRQLCVAVRWLRTATRVLWVVEELHAPTFGALERGAARLDWGGLVAAGRPREVRVRASAAKLHHTGAVAERVEAAIADQVGPAPAPTADDPAQRVDVRVEGSVAQIRIDATGEPADRRGWRLGTARAPLPPTVAAAVLQTIGWDGTVPLVDPLAGSGTIAIEAALRAAGREPWVGRRFALEGWPSFAPGTWASAAVAPHRDTTPHVRVVAGDRDAGAVGHLRDNAARAGLHTIDGVAPQHDGTAATTGADGSDATTGVRVLTASLTETIAAVATRCDGAPGTWPAGWVVTNPPWGHRVGGGDLRDLHAALGAAVRERLPGWGLAVLVADPTAAGHLGIPLEVRWRTTVGGIPVSLVVAQPGR